MTRDADFSPDTVRRLGERSAYRCSIPDCDKITIGPAANQDKSDCTGIASHIYSASPKGPRGTGGLTQAERKSIANGIWLCAVHASKVDKNLGDSYPADLLISYKDLHEARIAREQKDIYSPVGWFHELFVHSSPLFVPDTTIRFGKLTMIAGENDSGKTAICEWISGFGSSISLNRWGLDQSINNVLHLELTYYCPNPVKDRLEVSKNGELRRWHQSARTPSNALNLHFIFPKDIHTVLREGLDDLKTVAKILGVETSTVKAILPFTGQNKLTRVKNIRLVQSDNRDEIAADVEGTVPGLTFGWLSSSEQVRVIFELAVCLAQYTTEFGPTLLILDQMWIFDTINLASHAKYLSSTKFNFQTLCAIPVGSNDEMDKLKWSGWEIVRLEGRRHDVRVVHNVR